MHRVAMQRLVASEVIFDDQRLVSAVVLQDMVRQITPPEHLGRTA